MSDLRETLEQAVLKDWLLSASVANILQLLSGGDNPLYRAAIKELADNQAWDELNDRFYKTLAFGTGGLRGRTIGKVVTAAEQGEPQPLGRPQHSCIGTNAMNAYNISRATQGLVSYLKEWFAKNNLPGRPKIVVAHDTRHFSRDFTELTARVATENGADVCIFE